MGIGHNCSIQGILNSLDKLSSQDKIQAKLVGQENVVPTIEKNPTTLGGKWEQFKKGFTDIFDSTANFKQDPLEHEYLFDRDVWQSSKKGNPFGDRLKEAKLQVNDQNFNIDGQTKVLDPSSQYKVFHDYLMFKNFAARLKEGEGNTLGFTEAEAIQSANNLENIINQSPELKNLLDTYRSISDDVALIAQEYGIEYNANPDKLPYIADEYIQSVGQLTDKTYTDLERILNDHYQKVNHEIENLKFTEKVIHNYGEIYDPSTDVPIGWTKIQSRPKDVIIAAVGQEKPIGEYYRLAKTPLENLNNVPEGDLYIIPEKYANDIAKFSQVIGDPFGNHFRKILSGGSAFKGQVTGSAANPSILAYGSPIIGRQFIQDLSILAHHPEAVLSVPEVITPLYKFYSGDAAAEIRFRKNDGTYGNIKVSELAQGGALDGMFVDAQGQVTKLSSLQYKIKTKSGFFYTALGTPVIKQGALFFESVTNNILKLNQIREATTKAASLISHLKEDMTLPEAHYQTGEKTFNIEALTPTERTYMSGMLAPFYSTLKGVFVSDFKAYAGKFGAKAFAATVTMGVIIPAAIDSYNMANFPEQEEKLRKMRPDQRYIILGVDEDGTPYVLPFFTTQNTTLGFLGLDRLSTSMAKYLTHGTSTGDWDAAWDESMDIFTQALTAEGEGGLFDGTPILGPLEHTIKGFVAPGIKLGTQLMTNHNADTGAPLFKEDDNLIDKGKKLIGAAGQTYFPAIGNWGKLASKVLPDQVNEFFNPDFVPPRDDNAKATGIIDQLFGVKKDIKGSGALFQEEKEYKDGQKFGQSPEFKAFAEDQKKFERQERRSLNSDTNYVNLPPEARIKVQSLIKSGEDATGINRTSLQRDAKELDQLFADYYKGDRSFSLEELNGYKEDIQNDWEQWKAESDIRKQIAIDVVTQYSDLTSREQTDIYKELLNQESYFGEESTNDEDTEQE